MSLTLNPRRWFTGPKILLYAAALLTFAAWYVPRISAERFREPIRTALAHATGRKTEIGQVAFRLLPVPGFTIADVYVAEDPAIGSEPTYIALMSGRPRVLSLISGEIEFASVDLEGASINLTRVDRGPAQTAAVRWNFPSLFRPKPTSAFPSVHIIDGRVNFKFGDTKSIFYLLHTDVDLWPPPKKDGAWTLQVRAQPARTDRPSRGFGRFVARGEWNPMNTVVTLNVGLEKSELGDMVTLFEGRESWLQGHIRAEAHLSGPLSRVGLTGRMWVDDIHGWNQTPPGGVASPVSLGGAIDIPGQVVDIRATTEGKEPPVDLRYHASGYLARPRWGVVATFSELPIAPVIAVARNLGYEIPADLKLDGAAQGTLEYSMPDGLPRLNGQLHVGKATVAVADAPPLSIADADLQFAGSEVTLAPASITNDSSESAIISGNFALADRVLNIALSSDGMALASLRRQVSIARVPLLSAATSGTWSGNLLYSSRPGAEQNAGWSGEIRLKDADIPFEAFSQPVHVVLADAAIDGMGLATRRLSFTLGGIGGQGEYRYEIGAARPHRFRATLGTVNAAALERVLMPALHRGNFLDYALNLGKVPEPEWMRSLHADGTIQMAVLDLAGQSFTKLKARVQWDGDQIRVSGLQGNLQEASFAGTVHIDLEKRQPRYEIAGNMTGFVWHTGVLGADGSLTTLGTGTELLSNLKAEGIFRGRNIDLAPLEMWERIEGGFEWSWGARTPQLKLAQLVMTTAGNTFQGSAETRDDGQFFLRASDGTKQILASGALLQGEALKPVAP